MQNSYEPQKDLDQLRSRLKEDLDRILEKYPPHKPDPKEEALNQRLEAARKLALDMLRPAYERLLERIMPKHSKAFSEANISSPSKNTTPETKDPDIANDNTVELAK